MRAYRVKRLIQVSKHHTGESKAHSRLSGLLCPANPICISKACAPEFSHGRSSIARALLSVTADVTDTWLTRPFPLSLGSRSHILLARHFSQGMAGSGTCR